MITPIFSTLVLIRYLETVQDDFRNSNGSGLDVCNRLIEQCIRNPVQAKGLLSEI